jgi:hypothetical protein
VSSTALPPQALRREETQTQNIVEIFREEELVFKGQDLLQRLQ